MSKPLKKIFTVKSANKTIPLISCIAKDIERVWPTVTDENEKSINLLLEYLEEIHELGAEVIDYSNVTIAFPSYLKGNSRPLQLLWFIGENRVTKWKWLNSDISKMSNINYDY